MRAAVVLRDVSVSLDGAQVLQGVTAEVGKGEWLSLIGPNGAGKTTLLRAVAGLVAAGGEVVVGGCRPDTTRPRRLARLVAYVPQDPLLPVGMTVREYALLGRTAHVPYLGVESGTDLAVVDEVLATLELTNFASRALATLSGGERQRAVLARALSQEAPVLLLDEPTSALDLGHQHAVLELVDELRHRRDLTVVSAIHDLTLAAQFADRLLLLSDGCCAALGPPREVLTEERIDEHWGLAVRVLTDDAGGLAVVPLRRSRRLAEAVDG